VRAAPALSLKGRALRALSMREHSRQELVQKLSQYEEVPGELVKVLDELEAKDFINPQRVVDSVINRRAAKLGTLRIRQELQSKGLPAEAVQAAVADLKATELARAREVWRKRFGVVANSPEARMKQMRFLAGRGFGMEVLGRVVKGEDFFEN
jgi:regulatory protein